MTYQKKSWLSVRERLVRAREAMTAFRALPEEEQERGLLDDIVWQCWSFGEYAVNVCLELYGLPVPQDHSQPEQARQLYAQGCFSEDFSKALEQLERFRKQASHLSYNRERSTHYNPTNVELCLAKVEALEIEVEALLRSRGKL